MSARLMPANGRQIQKIHLYHGVSNGGYSLELRMDLPKLRWS